MGKTLIWDIPVRVFHWAFSCCLSLALIIAFTVDEDLALFQWHMLFGLMAAFLLVVRVFVGFVGGRYARLSGLFFRPSETINYLIESVTGKARRYAGHNPGAAAAALVMFTLVFGLVWTGLSMSTSEASEDLHAALAYGLLAAIGMHIAGLLLHTIQHRENIAMSMVTGRKEAPDTAALSSSKPLAGFATAMAVALCVGLLFKGYDTSTSSIDVPVFGQLILGESEHSRGNEDFRGGHEDEESSEHDG